MIYKTLKRVFYVGTQNKAYYKACGLTEEQLVYAPHCIDNQRFAPSAETIRAADKLRESMGIPPDGVIILFAGKLTPKKNPLLLVRAFVEGAFENAYLLIVGDGVLEPEVRQAAQQHPYIKVQSFQNQQQMPVVYQACQVFCMPSAGPGETWGLALNEAMASGKAIIASTKCGGAYDLIENGHNGYVFENNNLKDLKLALAQLLDNRNYILLGRNSLQKIEQFTLAQTASTLVKGISEL